jgi:hypothetical protein
LIGDEVARVAAVEVEEEEARVEGKRGGERMGEVRESGGEKERRLSAAWMMARPCVVSLRCISTGEVSTRLLPSGDLIPARPCLRSCDISTRGLSLSSD